MTRKLLIFDRDGTLTETASGVAMISIKMSDCREWLLISHRQIEGAYELEFHLSNDEKDEAEEFVTRNQVIQAYLIVGKDTLVIFNEDWDVGMFGEGAIGMDLAAVDHLRAFCQLHTFGKRNR